jgi:hypothetical protein
MHPASLLRLPSHSPLGRLHYYANIEDVTPAAIFGTGLLEEEQPSAPWDSESAIADAGYYPQTVIILGETAGNRFISGLLEDRYSAELIRPYLTILRRRE